MVVGIIVGTYSTIFIACPIVVWWESFRKKNQRTSAARAAL
jgi:preprotein translocase subunit SecF